VSIDGTDYVLPLGEPVDVRAQTLTLAATLGGTKYEARATAATGRVTVIEMTAQESDGRGCRGRAATRVVGRRHDRLPADCGAAIVLGRRTRHRCCALRVGLVGVGAGILFGASSNSAADKASELQSA